MFCPKCGYENVTGAHFCVKCGTPFPQQDPPVNQNAPVQQDVNAPSKPTNPNSRKTPVLIGVGVAAAIAGIALLVFLVLPAISSNGHSATRGGNGTSASSSTENNQSAADSAVGESDEQPAQEVDAKSIEETFVGSWDFIGGIGEDSADYNGTIVIQEDGTAYARLLEMSLPAQDGSRTIIGEEERQDYTWKADGSESIILKPQKGTTAFDGADLSLKPYPEWSDEAWPYTLIVNDKYMLGSNQQFKRAGWEKHVDADDFVAFQVRDMDVTIADDDVCTIRVLGSGCEDHGTIGYLLEVTNKTDEEINISIDHTESYNKWTVNGERSGNPEFENRYVAAKSTEKVFMYFHETITGGDEPLIGYDGELDDFHDVKGALKITLQDSYDSSSYEFNV